MPTNATTRLTKRTAHCPACGGLVEFRLSTSLVSICDYCHSVVSRTDRKLEEHGKVAELHETGSPLSLGQKGKWNGKTLRLVGRVQYRHPAGGVWDEWYVALSQGSWGWLAEAQGKFFLTFQKSLAPGSALPEMDGLSAGQSLTLGDTEFTVNEIGTATFAAAEGELPFDPQATSTHRFVDLSSSGGVFATLDYSGDSPTVYLGREVTLDQLEIQGLDREPEEHAVGAVQLSCPQCAGPLSLMAPDSAERVTCPSCHSLLDVTGNKLEYLSTLKPPKPALVIPLGSVGTLRGVKYTVIGYLRRSVTYDKMYYWSEYLLYHPRDGFRWLVHSDDHWSFVKTVLPADVKISDTSARWQGRTFKLFQSTLLTVRQVFGEFYWKVQIDEEVLGKDFLSPPDMISVETSDPRLKGSTGKEVNVSIGEYLPHEELEQAFGLKNLARGWGIAPNQPNPVGNQVFMYWGLYLLVIAGIWAAASSLKTGGVDAALTEWAILLVSLVPLVALAYKHSVEVSRWKDSEFNPYASGDDSDE